VDVNVSATVKVRVTVDADKWAAESGVETVLASASLAAALSEALEHFADLVPEVDRAGGQTRIEKLTWTASTTSPARPS
jgi:hypothetical protein